MPVRKYRKTSSGRKRRGVPPYRRRRYGKRRGGLKFYKSGKYGNKYQSIAWKSPIAPDEMRLKFNYTYTGHLNSIATASHMFSGNSPYDPDATGTGRQPPAWDDYSGLYDKYQCVGSKAEVTFHNSSVNTAPAACILTAQVTSTFTTNTITDVSTGQNPWNQYNTKTVVVGGANYSGTKKKVRMYRSTRKLLGRDYIDDDTKSFTNNNPVARWYWAVGAFAYDASDTLDVYYTIKLTYYVIMYQRNESATKYD